MATPCRAHRCPELVTSRAMKGYCDKHSELRSKWVRDKKQGKSRSWERCGDRRGTTTERGYGHAWRKRRVIVLERDGYLCVYCSKQGKIEEATDVDHIINKAVGGTDDLDNLQSLCAACHKDKTYKESRGRAGKKLNRKPI